MESRITIEIDFENNNQPYIKIIQAKRSDDVRDKLLSHFLELLGGSSWCHIKWENSVAENEPAFFASQFKNRIHITPIKKEDFKAQAKLMLEQDKQK